MNKALEYFKGDELAASTWLNKYAAKGEETPNDTHKRIAKEFARIENKYNWELAQEKKLKLSNFGYERPQLDEEAIFELFKDFKYIIPGGSVLSGCGTDDLVSLSNCFVIGSPQDSYAEIMKTRNQQVQLMKRRGGVGYDLSELRPRGAAVNNAAKSSTGAASFMDVNSDLTNETAQNGRRGALMLSININHPDVEEFITKKQDLTKVTGANISVKVTDEFMTAVEKDTDYILRFPVTDTSVDDLQKESPCKAPYNELCDTLDSKGNVMCYYKRIKARELWSTLMKCAWNTAEPGILFETAMHNYSPDGVYRLFRMISTNPCQPAWATVLTPNGVKTIGDIIIGDKIWSSEGWTTVVNKWSTGVKDVHEYRTTAGSFYGTNTHRVVQKGLKVEARNAESIDVLSGIVCNKDYTLSPQDILDGLVLGDGSVHKASNNLVYLCIGQNDTDYFNSEIKSLIGKHRKALKDYAYEIQTTIQACELPKTYDREVPDRFFNGDYVKVLGFLRGIYSANGSVVNQRVTLKTSSAKLRDQIQIMLSSVGIRSYYTTNKPNKVTFSNGEYECKESYDVNISTDRELFYHTIGFLQTYKMEKLSKIMENIKQYDKTANIVSDTIISTEEVFDITVDNKSHTYWTGGLNVSNCGEIPMGPFDSCRLIHINLLSFIDNPFTHKARINEEKLYEVAYLGMRLADDLVDLEIEAIDRIIDAVKNDEDFTEFNLWSRIKEATTQGRRAGLGFTGLADAIAMLGLKYDSEKGLAAVNQIMKIMFLGQLDSTIDMAIERGHFPAFDSSLEYLDSDLVGGNDWYSWLMEEFPERARKMCLYGRRNISWSTVAPTGTVSILAGCSSGIEPVFMPFYQRRRKCMSPEDRVDFTDKMGINYSTFLVVHPKLKEWAETHYNENVDNWGLDMWEKIYLESPYYESTASEIDWRQRVKLQGIVQKYITHSISSTINLPKETTQEEIADIYLEAWRAGNKGQTIYRDGCRDGVLSAISKEKPKTLEGRGAPKRPKDLEADYYQVRVKGEQFIVLVGLFDGKPYEIFTFRPNKSVNIDSHKGIITKVKKGKYSFNSQHINISDLQLANENIEETAATLYSSMLLRHGVDINYIVKTAKKGNENITSFSSAMCRILSKYIKDGEIEERCPNCGEKLYREGGCKICKSCGESACS